MHAPAHVDRVDLHVAVVSEGGAEVGRGLGEQKRAVDEGAGFGRSEFQRGQHADQRARIAARNKAVVFAGHQSTPAVRARAARVYAGPNALRSRARAGSNQSELSDSAENSGHAAMSWARRWCRARAMRLLTVPTFRLSTTAISL